jgi:hypothetical protein
METKIGKVRALWAVGDRIDALKIAARFGDRSAETLLCNSVSRRYVRSLGHPDLPGGGGRREASPLTNSLVLKL